MSRVQVRASAIVAVVMVGLARIGLAQLSDTFTNWLDHPAIAYTSTPANDRVARLNRDLEGRRVRLVFEGPSGYLRATLEALDVPIESQIAVFVPDSLQRGRIGLGNPRTIFFNDSVAVAWVRGGFIELASQDPEQGLIFYMLDGVEVDTPRFARRNDCLTCHYSFATAGIPGTLARSSGRFVVDHRVPLDQRWGGWYVTGRHGSLRHLGNLALERLQESPTANTSNWPSLEGRFDATGYLSRYSDIVALMVFDHQMHAMNLIGRIGWESRVAAFQQKLGRVAFNHPQGTQADVPVPLGDAARELVDYLLFVDEAALPDPIQGSSGFAERFMAQGPRDRKGRSLRELDLRTRLLRYPCSYMIYSDAFKALPLGAKRAVYQRLWHVLSGDEHDARYRRLSAEDRQAVMEILRDTTITLP
jgi:hypothetical protein